MLHCTLRGMLRDIARNISRNGARVEGLGMLRDMALT